MKSFLFFIFNLLLFSCTSQAQIEVSDQQQISNEVAQFLIANQKGAFISKYAPRKDDLLEFSYGEKSKRISMAEKIGFFNEINSTLDFMHEELTTSFDFVKERMATNGINAIDKVEVIKVTEAKFGDNPVNNLYLAVYEGKNQFKIEILGLYKTSRGWVILKDIAPAYF